MKENIKMKAISPKDVFDKKKNQLAQNSLKGSIMEQKKMSTLSYSQIPLFFSGLFRFCLSLMVIGLIYWGGGVIYSKSEELGISEAWKTDTFTQAHLGILPYMFFGLVLFFMFILCMVSIGKYIKKPGYKQADFELITTNLIESFTGFFVLGCFIGAAVCLAGVFLITKKWGLYQGIFIGSCTAFIITCFFGFLAGLDCKLEIDPEYKVKSDEGRINRLINEK